MIYCVQVRLRRLSRNHRAIVRTIIVRTRMILYYALQTSTDLSTQMMRQLDGYMITINVCTAYSTLYLSTRHACILILQTSFFWFKQRLAHGSTGTPASPYSSTWYSYCTQLLLLATWMVPGTHQTVFLFSSSLTLSSASALSSSIPSLESSGNSYASFRVLRPK